jgi:urocanate hydratase
VQSGKPVGVFRTHADAPRVLIANSNLVPHWATWEHFNELDKKGLMMYGQMTAGSWIYIGSQGIVQGTYETFVEDGPPALWRRPQGQVDPDRRPGRHGRRAAAGRDDGGGLLPRVECQRRASISACAPAMSMPGADLDEALAMHREWTAKGEAKSVGLLGNAAEMFPELVRRMNAACARCVTDQTSRTIRCTAICRKAGRCRAVAGQAGNRSRRRCEKAGEASMRVHVAGDARFLECGRADLDYGNNIRQVAKDEGLANAFAFPGFVPAYIRPLFCRGIGPFRWVALSGDPEDIYKTDAKVKELIPDDAHLHRWLDMAARAHRFQGLPARICWVGLGRATARARCSTRWCASGELKAPIVIGRDHLDSGSVASPNRETEAMKDGSDAVRLAAAQRAAQHRVGARPGCRCTTAAASAWAFRSIRRGDRLRRHAGSRQAHRAGAVERPGHRRDAPCRCGLRDREWRQVVQIGVLSLTTIVLRCAS